MEANGLAEAPLILAGSQALKVSLTVPEVTGLLKVVLCRRNI